jgi:hypothetical protein
LGRRTAWTIGLFVIAVVLVSCAGGVDVWTARVPARVTAVGLTAVATLLGTVAAAARRKSSAAIAGGGWSTAGLIVAGPFVGATASVAAGGLGTSALGSIAAVWSIAGVTVLAAMRDLRAEARIVLVCAGAGMFAAPFASSVLEAFVAFWTTVAVLAIWVWYLSTLSGWLTDGLTEKQLGVINRCTRVQLTPARSAAARSWVEARGFYGVLALFAPGLIASFLILGFVIS